MSDSSIVHRHRWLQSVVTHQDSVVENLSWNMAQEWAEGCQVVIMPKADADRMLALLDQVATWPTDMQSEIERFLVGLEERP